MRHFLFFMMILCAHSSFAQTGVSAAKQNLQKKYPAAQDVVWDQSSDGIEAEFSLNETYAVAQFDGKGSWLETRFSLEEEGVPKSVIQACKKKYPASDIYQVDRVEKANGEHFEVNLSYDGTDFLITLSTDGKITKTEAFSSEDEDDSEE